jgi:hypothetical protein
MIDIPYTLIIEATEDPEFFGFFLLIWRDSQVSAILSRIVFIKLGME